MDLDDLAPAGMPQFKSKCPKCGAIPGRRCVVTRIVGGVVKVRVRDGAHMARISVNFRHARSVDPRQRDFFGDFVSPKRRKRRLPRRVNTEEFGVVKLSTLGPA